MIDYNKNAEVFAKLSEAVTNMGIAVGEVVKQITENYLPIVRQMYEDMYRYYVAIGSPCGKDKRGFNKWLKSMKQEEDNDV